ncbi:MAG TPA: hypothetical protein VGE29_14030 [Prosthecobacter sp.]
MNQSDLIAELRKDANWNHWETDNFEIFARRQLLLSGRSACPVMGIDGRVNQEGVPVSSGFHGLPDVAWGKLCGHVQTLDKEHFSGVDFPNRRSRDRVPVVVWDAWFPYPADDLAGGVSSKRADSLQAAEPQVFENDKSTTGGLADFFILAPIPTRYYWGNLRPEWLCGAVTHEICHVWTSWSGPPKLATFALKCAWKVADEITAVWAESAWTNKGRSFLDYAAEWTMQSGVSLYGVEIPVEGKGSKRFSSKQAFGYYQWPFLCWVEERCPGLIKAWWRAAQAGGHVDPWRCLDAVIRGSNPAPNHTLSWWFGRYAGESFTSEFMERHLPVEDAQWYLKVVEEVFDLNQCPKPLRVPGRMLPLSKRAFLLRNVAGSDRRWQARLETTLPGFGLHMVQEDGNGVRKAVLKSSDYDPPYVLEVPEAEFVIVVVYCSKLNGAAQRVLGAETMVSADPFTLVVDEV